ncbi:MAG: response regulator [Candidatus Saccharimonadales bacterium]
MDNSKTQPSNGKKVLVIEDERFIGELYVRALSRGGYEVKVIADGEDALAESKTDKYDIILLDIMLPTIAGTEILHRLREETPNLRARIIITTNLELSEESRTAIENQADGYIVKAEVTPHELTTFLDQLELNK